MLIDVNYNAAVPGQPPHGYIFVLSHMRSFSSLLCHIMGSHGEISGYAEMHLTYDGRNDLRRLARKVENATGAPVRGGYVLDKMLHADQYISPAVLARPELKGLLLVRNPDDTIRSILNMTRSLGWDRLTEPEEALDYYASRLRQLEAYSAQLRGNALFMDAESLIDDTDAVLAGLSRWLNLKEPLSATYRTFRLSGAKGYGDPSPNIMAGKVVRDAEERHRGYVPMLIPDSVLRQAQEVYAACRATLSSRHDTLPGHGGAGAPAIRAA